MQEPLVSHVDSTSMRQAGRDLLSLALMDARNHTLHLATQLEASLGAKAWLVPPQPGLAPPLWTLGQVGWFQEWWIARNLQRHRGAKADPTTLRLASIDPQADHWFKPVSNAPEGRWALTLPELGAIKTYLLDTLEATLELLEKTPDEDEALYFFRLALFHEDMQGEALITLAQALDLPLGLTLPGPAPTRAPILVPATRWTMGIAAGAGFVFDNEQPAFELHLPEFEIDAQAVCWAQFVEFVDDDGYDREDLWTAQGWKWLQGKAAAEGRRGPRYVDQIGVASGAVMQTRFGKPMRMLGTQAATHLTWFEADAWARWAGRRLPAEVEWEAAAHTAASRGFRFGDVWEWTGSSFRGYQTGQSGANGQDGFKAGPWADYSQPNFNTHKVLRGGSFATRARLKSAKFRHFGLPESDEMFCGFRTCAF